MFEPEHISYFSLDIIVRYKAVDNLIHDEKMAALFTFCCLSIWETITMDNVNENKITQLTTMFGLDHDQVSR